MNLSACQLSERTGIALVTIQGILEGTREPKLSHLYMLADTLNVAVTDLIGTHVNAQTSQIAS